ncbi:peptide methionine sulfoxide reductase isoform X2 [Photinus pyralis]|nr:peptide methionine sulfoxide reductase isoform X2 [Photinus pyralis]
MVFSFLTRIKSINVKMTTMIPHEITLPFDKATFGMGCFWANDALFGATQGVLRTRVGYSGGKMLNPTYRNIMDHTEVIEIHYDPTAITYQQLLELFWNNHEYGLTTKIKRQYASLILYHNNGQRSTAEDSLEQERLKHKEEMCTEIKPAAIFYPAEDYHQKYRLQQHPQLCKALMLNSQLLQDSHVAARLNGYVAGVGSVVRLNEDLKTFGLPDNLVEYVRKVHQVNKESGLYC